MAKKKTKRVVPKTELNRIIATVSEMKLGHPEYQRRYLYVEDYLRYEYNTKDLKKEALTWLQKHDKKLARLAPKVEDWRFMILGKLCFVLNHGGQLTDNAHQYIDKKINEIKQLVKERHIGQPTKSKKTSKLTIQDHLLHKARNFAADYVDSEIDNIFQDSKYKVSVDPYSAMMSEKISQGHAKYIIQMYQSDIEDLQCLVSGTADAQLKEGYSSSTKKQIKSALDFYNKTISAANMIIKKSVANRKPRKTSTKQRDFIKDVSGFKYRTECSEMGLVSVSPIKIIGAKEVWVYNTVTRKLGKYCSMDDTGLDVSGTSIKNYSQQTSVSKTLRNPETQLKNFSGGIRKYNNQFKQIKGKELAVKTRLNTDTIILKCFK